MRKTEVQHLVDGQKCVLFDFDGTLADSLGMALAIMNKKAKRLNIKPISPSDIAHLRQLGYRKALKRHNIWWWKIPILVRMVQKEMKRRVSEIRIHNGIKPLLQDLNEKGYLLGVVTSNSVATVSGFRSKNNLPELHIIASSPGIFGKHRVLKKVIRSFDLRPDQVLYVGDEPRDMTAAVRVGMPCVGVLWGLSDAELLLEHGANAIVRTPNELKRTIKHIF